MTDDETPPLSRRTLLGGIATVGAAGVLGGSGTMAYFSDEEEFANNQLTAGSLDMKVSWEEHYSNWLGAEEEVDGVRMVEEAADLTENELGLPSSDEPLLAVRADDTDGDGVPQIDEFMAATLQEQYPPPAETQPVPPDPVQRCEARADLPEDLDEGGQLRPLIDLSDVKPGDFGEVTFDFVLCDNPGYVWLTGGLRSAAENGLTEPERKDEDEDGDPDSTTPTDVELLDEIRAVVWYDDGDNILEETESYVTDVSVVDGNPSSSAVALTGDRRIVAEGSLREVTTRLSTAPGVPLDGFPDDDPRDCHTSTPTVHYVGFAWYLPVDHANEIQTDSVEFDVGFYTEQCRHNDGVGLSSGLLSQYPLDVATDGTVADVVGGLDGTVNGAVSFVEGQKSGAADFDGTSWIGVDGFPNLTSSFTISAWVRTRDNGEIGQRIFTDDETNTGGYALSLGDPGPGRLRFYSRNLSPISLDTGPVIADNTWYHVAAVVDTDAGTRRIYVDGTEEASGSYTGSWGTDAGLASIGGETDAGESASRFDGAIDDLRIYDRVLSPTEVATLASDP
jgi:predicted ribosomally synthesized peptide with SipW-like signal peptide